MLSFAKSSASAGGLNKSVRTPLSALPGTAVRWDVLQSAEIQFQRRGMLPRPTATSFNPLWFSAETERNVFLWQRGCSLSDAPDFEFWIDVPKLLDKRRAQLAKGDTHNPFTNPMWGEPDTDPSLGNREVEYLEQFEELISEVGAHAHALSVVGSKLDEQLHGPRERVLLPRERRRG